MLKEFSHTTKKSFDDAISDLKEALMSAKFGTLCQINMHEKFKDKGIDFNGKITILEICNPYEAFAAINIHPQAIYFLPCKFVVKESNGVGVIEMVKPSSLMHLLEEPRLVELAVKVETALINAALTV
ncbi:MAG: hypothetical protein CVU94_05045 [Firmicutes bacterium HGW-Firmicutes-19]|jgi:uncharacterized protein (DUF302 family)|nr:MAG: hypothetical protein CVU94_05045 [Firmicutes bacterium HGW-Firmicutes-19]